jgi:DNA-binding XRE family transcriptional regulator
MGDEPKFESHLFEARMEKGYSLEEVARKANVSKEAVRKIEKGISIPGLFVAIAIASAVGWLLGDLFKPIKKGDD